MGLYKNALNQYYQIKVASEERISFNGETIKKGETYLRFYKPREGSEKLSITIISLNLELSLVGFFKLPDNIYRETKTLRSEKCDCCKVYFLTDYNARFCSVACAERNFELETSEEW